MESLCVYTRKSLCATELNMNIQAMSQTFCFAKIFLGQTLKTPKILTRKNSELQFLLKSYIDTEVPKMRNLSFA